RRVKRSRVALPAVAGGLVAIHGLDVFWRVRPSLEPGSLSLHLADLVAPLAVGGIWIRTYLFHLRRRPLLPAGGVQRAGDEGPDRPSDRALRGGDSRPRDPHAAGGGRAVLRVPPLGRAPRRSAAPAGDHAGRPAAAAARSRPPRGTRGVAARGRRPLEFL